jgi:hypothetical protein
LYKKFLNVVGHTPPNVSPCGEAWGWVRDTFYVDTLPVFGITEVDKPGTGLVTYWEIDSVLGLI